MYLNVGSNDATIEGFVNIDIEPVADVCCDVRWNLPFRDAAFDGVYSEHFIEHIPQRDAVAFLRECRRVTRLGGRIRIATPDLDWIVRRYHQEDWRQGDMFANGYGWVATRAEQLNLAMREWGHQWLYDEEELCRIGGMAGLELLGRVAPGQSDVAELANRETRPGSRLVVEFEHRRPTPSVHEPMVSILIPAYRAAYLDEALHSARAQTWRRLEIVVGDDCPDEAVADIVSAHAAEDARVRYLRNDPPSGARANYYRLFREAAGEYIKYLNDDDVLHPRAVERMASCLRALPRVSLVTSHRRRIAGDGTFLGDDGATASPVHEDAVLHGPGVVASMLGRLTNWVGEPTTTMFRREDVTSVEPELFAFGGRAAIANGDLTLWTRLLSRGDLCYLRSTLSLFRQHDGQAQADEAFRQRAGAAWQQLDFDAARMGLTGPALRRVHARPLDLPPWWATEARDAVLAADAALADGRADAALRHLTTARAASGGDGSIALLEARLAVALGEPDHALRALGEAAAHDPWNALVPLEVALVLADVGRFDEADEALQRATTLAPDSEDVAAVRHRITGVAPALVVHV